MPEDKKIQGEEKKNIIEIPQEYYDKLEQGKREKERVEEQQRIEQEQMKENRSESGMLLLGVLLQGILLFASLYSLLHISIYAIAILFIYFVIGSFISASSAGKKSLFSTSVLIGGIVSGIVTFLLSFVFESQMDLYTYYAVASVIVGIVGAITSSLVCSLRADTSIKALQKIGIFIYFVLLVGGPYYCMKHFPEQFNHIVLRKTNEVVAQTEQEFTEKTLKNRYGVTFTCGKPRRSNNVHNYVTWKRTCKDSEENTITVLSTVYNESEVLYVVQDNYMDIRLLNAFLEEVESDLNSITGGKVDIALYPKTGCAFVGDCHDCDEYIENYKEENDLDRQYTFSSTLDLKKYLSMSGKDFVNAYSFKYIIDISGKYGGMADSMYEEIVTNVLNRLNTMGLSNTFGYEISIQNKDQYNKVLYRVKGVSSSSFEKPEVVSLN